MITSVFTCSCDAKIKSIIKEMSRRDISSVVVTNNKGNPIGIITERDIIKKIIAEDGVNIENISAGKIMTPKPITLNPEDTIYKALSILLKYKIKHLPICKHGKVIGIVTLRQLLKLKYPEPMTLILEIEQVEDIKILKSIKNKLFYMVAEKLSFGIGIYEIITMLSLINQEIHRKVLEIAIKYTGKIPFNFCLFVSGSHGRMETLLNSDQDHGMVIEDNKDFYYYQDYFIKLSEKFSTLLKEVGYPECPGYIMSINPLWRKQLSEWKIQIKYWLEKQINSLTRYMTILFDSLPIYGDKNLFDEIINYAYMLIEINHEVIKIMKEEQSRHKVPVGIFGKFITERKKPHQGEIDLKKSGLLFIVESIRIFALKYKIKETSTIVRIEKLVNKGVIHPDDGEYFESAYYLLLYFILRNQLEKAFTGKEITTYITPSKLSSYDRESLKHAFKAVSSLQELVASEFGEIVL